jgi:transposase
MNSAFNVIFRGRTRATTLTLRRLRRHSERPKNALCTDQERRPTGSAVPASSAGALGDAWHRSHQPDSWLIARTWNHLAPGRRQIDAALPGILEDASAKLSGAVRLPLAQLKLELDHLQMRIDEADAMINKAAGENEACHRLVAIPGIGAVTATAIVAAISNGAAFKKGRRFSAWLGIVPGEYTTGGKQKLLGISKRGDSYLRSLLVQGGPCRPATEREAILRSPSA